jgi:hypothetical protein
MTLHEIVRVALVNRFVNESDAEMDGLAHEIVTAVLKHLHDTGALSVPPEDIARHADALTDPHNATP